MKDKNLRKILPIIVVLYILWIAAGIIFDSIGGIFWTLFAVFAIAIVVIEIKLSRCPNCNRFIPQRTIRYHFCPFCGYNLFEQHNKTQV